MRKIKDNGPTFTKLEVRATKGWHHYQPPGNNWEVFGRVIGMNTHLKEISLFDGNSRDTSEKKRSGSFLTLSLTDPLIK